ncbi:mandelate racemase/muconate lactonizing enzyme family protein [Haloarchaeobius sp. TZWSO28]|uniref:mandelate racemase/muconate lactonizing enzyme family protein n=1 Tax=Haloarchaeobius sp. TZWSO28 TaxID=3446119 RepID=UPI003EBA7CEE
MSDLRITETELYVLGRDETGRKPLVFVRLVADDGTTGLGEVPIRPDKHEVLPLLASMADSLVGTDPFETERLLTGHGSFAATPNTLLASTIRGGLDIACWDLKGKYLGCPVYELLGGAVDGRTIPVYANGWYADRAMTTDEYRHTGRDPAQVAEAARAVVDRGYDAMKIDPFGPGGVRMSRAERNRSVEIVAAVRDEVGPDVDLFIEGHKLFTTAGAIEMASLLEPYEPGFFEEPTPPDLGALESVAATSAVPIATGETLPSHRSFAPLLAETRVSVVQPDAIVTGGVTELRKVAALASAHNVSFAPHNSNGPVSTAVAAQVAVTAETFTIQETFQDFVPHDWHERAVEDPLDIVDGELTVPDRPGIGLTLDLDELEDFRYQP